MKQNEITMSEQEMVEFVNMYIGIVPKNQLKKVNSLDLKSKVQKIKFYQDMIKMREDARIKNSIPNKVKDMFEAKHGTVEDAKSVIILSRDENKKLHIEIYNEYNDKVENITLVRKWRNWVIC